MDRAWVDWSNENWEVRAGRQRINWGTNLFWNPIEKAEERNYNVELTGFEFNDGELIYEYETERAFNGDGYSIWIYKLDNETAHYFKNPKEEFFTKYPSMELRSHWMLLWVLNKVVV